MGRELGKDWTTPPDYMSAMRHLTVEILYCPRESSYQQETKPQEKNISSTLSEHVSSLTSLFQNAKALHTLHLTITPPDSLSNDIVLASLFSLQSSPYFVSALVSLSLSNIALSFEFPDCYYRTSISPEFLLQKGLLLLACKVLFWRSHLRVEQVVQELDGKTTRQEGNSEDKIDLEGLVGNGHEEFDIRKVIGRVAEVEDMLGEAGRRMSGME